MTESALVPALAAALLAGPWTEQDMATRVRTSLGLTRALWPARVAARVLTEFPSPPHDAPRRLARFVGGLDVLDLAARSALRRGRPLQVVHLFVAPARMGRNRFGVPPLESPDDLASLLGVSGGELAWFCDLRGYQRRAPGPTSTGRLHHYRSRWVAKRGAPRLLEAPRPRLRELQRTVLHGILDVPPAHPAVHGFVPGRSAVTGAARHTAAGVVVRVDLSAFFASVPASRVHGVFRGLGYPEAVAHALTGLTTHRTPVAEITRMPAGGSPAGRTALRQWLSAAHLPQGAPTSPALANLVAHRLDRRLTGLADSLDLTYTRYADDLTFSGSPVTGPGRGAGAWTRRLVGAVGAIAADEGFTVHPTKTLVRGAGARQVVTGVVVNEHPNVAREEFDRLRAVLHNCVVHGPRTQDREGHRDFRGHLAGRVGWFETVNPAKARRLRKRFEQIEW